MNDGSKSVMCGKVRQVQHGDAAVQINGSEQTAVLPHFAH